MTRSISGEDQSLVDSRFCNASGFLADDVQAVGGTHGGCVSGQPFSDQDHRIGGYGKSC